MSNKIFVVANLVLFVVRRQKLFNLTLLLHTVENYSFSVGGMFSFHHLSLLSLFSIKSKFMAEDFVYGC